MISCSLLFSKDFVSMKKKNNVILTFFSPKIGHVRLTTDWSVVRTMKVMVFYLIDWDNPSCQSANSSKTSLLPTQILQGMYIMQSALLHNSNSIISFLVTCAKWQINFQQSPLSFELLCLMFLYERYNTDQRTRHKQSIVNSVLQHIVWWMELVA